MLRFMCVLGLACGTATAADPLDGVWLVERATLDHAGQLPWVWHSTVTLKDGTFALSKLYNQSHDLCGTFTLDPKAGTLDLKTDEYSLSTFNMLLPASTLPAVYALDGDRLSVRFVAAPNAKRPPADPAAERPDKLAALTLVRAPKDFNGFPKEVTVKVLNPDGKPAGGVPVSTHLGRYPDPKNPKAEPEWTMSDPHTTAADGTFKVKYHHFPGAVLARDEKNKLTGVAFPNPAALAASPITTVQLVPECRVSVSATCKGFDPAGAEKDAFGCYVYAADGSRIAYNGGESGKLDFPLPPGEYTLYVYGSSVIGQKRVPLSVPTGRGEYTAPEVAVPPTGLMALLGKPAPELTGVLGWKGEAVKLADLKGKVVLLEFWGYWCGPCIGSMPVLFELHDTFKDDLAIVGVHVDPDGGVSTAKALDEELAGHKKNAWKGRDLPFPSALVSGTRAKADDERGEMAKRYGVQSYPRTILIDRAGNVVGTFNARDAKEAVAAMEKVLKAEKK